MLLLDRFLALAHGPETLRPRVGEHGPHLGGAVFPLHVHTARVVQEVVEIQLELSVVLQLNDLVERVEVLGLAVGREPHDLVLVAVA